jgi:hypothetical protein
VKSNILNNCYPSDLKNNHLAVSNKPIRNLSFADEKSEGSI